MSANKYYRYIYMSNPTLTFVKWNVTVLCVLIKESINLLPTILLDKSFPQATSQK